MSRLVLALALLWPTAGTTEPVSVEEGRRLFALHCAACHGGTAEGAGAMAPVLESAPEDLTGLSARNGGQFPTEMIIAKIDGRISLDAHGGAMPVYGWFFDGPEAAVTPANGPAATTTEAIAAIVLWLATRQR
jgi:mono/diheme cytochrome c family protein